MKIIKNEKGTVMLRLDGATTNSKYLVQPHYNHELKASHFGEFRFKDTEMAEAFLRKAVQSVDGRPMDTIFGGSYPKWSTSNYGTVLKCSNKVKFYKSAETKEIVPDDEIKNYVYSIEVHLTATKNNDIYLRVLRAIVTGERESGYNDDLFEDMFKGEE